MHKDVQLDITMEHYIGGVMTHANGDRETRRLARFEDGVYERIQDVPTDRANQTLQTLNGLSKEVRFRFGVNEEHTQNGTTGIWMRARGKKQ